MMEYPLKAGSKLTLLFVMVRIRINPYRNLVSMQLAYRFTEILADGAKYSHRFHFSYRNIEFSRPEIFALSR